MKRIVERNGKGVKLDEAVLAEMVVSPLEERTAALEHLEQMEGESTLGSPERTSFQHSRSGLILENMRHVNRIRFSF